MKAKTKIQKEFLHFAEKELKMPKSAYRRAIKARHKTGFINSTGKISCHCCGNQWKPKKVPKIIKAIESYQSDYSEASCSKCRNKLRLTTTQKRTDDDEWWVDYYRLQGDWYIRSIIICNGYYKNGQKEKVYTYTPQHQITNLKNGYTYVYGRYSQSTWSGTRFCGSDELRNIENKYRGRSWSFINDIDVWPQEFIDIDFNHIEEIRKHTIHPFDKVLKLYKGSPHFETVVKQLDPDIWKTIVTDYSLHHFKIFWPSLKMMIRYKWKPPNINSYFDFLNQLVVLKKDRSNPSVCCPSDFNKMHGEYSRILRRREKRKQEERERQLRLEQRKEEKRKLDRMTKALKDFAKRMKKFKSFQVVRKNFVVKIATTGDDLYKAGEDCNHCIYQISYVNKKDTVYFLAYSEGKIIEAYDVNIKNKEIIHSGGYNNMNCKYHKEVKKIVISNMDKVQKMFYAKPVKRKKKSNLKKVA